MPSGELNHALVTLHSDDAGIPGELVARLVNPENLAVGSNTFQAPADTWLEADTTYYLAVNVEADAGIVFGLGVTAGIGDSPDSDWSVEDMSWTRRDDGGWGIDVTSVLQFSLDGAPRPPAPTPAAALVSRVAPPQEPLAGVEQPRMFVSNSEQPPSAWSRSVMGQGFTTGSAARGYMLGSVELYLETPPADGLTMPLVTLHADESGSPGELLARFRNPDSFTAGANRFWAPFTAVLDANQTYYVVANLGADAPQAFNLVTSGKADVPTGDPEWSVQTGSWLLSSGWQWQPNENHGLRFALYEPGKSDPQFLSKPSEEITGTPAWEPASSPEPSSATEPQSATELLSEQELLGEPEEVAAAPPPPAPPPAPPASSTPEETVATTLPPPPAPATSKDDEDDDPPPAWTRNPGTWMAATGIAGLVLGGGSDDGGTPPQEPVGVTPPPPPPPPPPSGNAALIGLTVTQLDGTSITLTPLFSAAMNSYSASVANAVGVVTILPTTSDDNAQFQFMDANDVELADADSGLSDFQANAAVGANMYRVKVTAEDGETVESYSVSIDRAMAAPEQVTGVGVDPAIESLMVSWDPAENADTYKVQWKKGEEDFEAGGDREQPVNGGGTASTIQNLTPGMEYTLRVIGFRYNVGDGPPSQEAKGIPMEMPMSTDATLSNLRVTETDGTAITLSPSTFSSTVTNYSASVANAVATVTILPTTSDANAQVQYLDANDMELADENSGTSNFQANLAVGANTFKVKITAEDDLATKTYTLNLRRAVAPPGQAMNIRVLPRNRALIALWESVSDADGYRVQWKSGTEDFESGGDREDIVGNGSTEFHTILNLVAGTEYTVRLIATRTGAADGMPSNEATGTPYSSNARSVGGGSGGGGSGGGGNTNTVSALTNLEVRDPDNVVVTLSPTFRSSRSSYRASVASTVSWVTFNPELESGATLEYEDGSNYPLSDVYRNLDGFQVNLLEGANIVRLRVTPSGGTSAQTYSVAITRARENVVEGNTPPAFSASRVTLSFYEDVGDGTRGGADVGGPVTADDTDNDQLTYTLEGPDEALFSIHYGGQICTRAGYNYDRERVSNYSVTVRVEDGRGGSDTIDVAIEVLNVEEKPQEPDAPTVSAVSGSSTSLSVTWTAPSNTGRPSISSYDLQYSKPNDQSWTDGPQNRSGTSATISSLDPDMRYLVQVRATNADGDGPWSNSGMADTNAESSQVGSDVIRSFDEDVGDAMRSGVDVGSPVTASNHGSSHSYTLGGTDSGSFTIGSSTGQIRSGSGVNFDYEVRNSYSVTVESNDGSNTESIQVTINLNDVAEFEYAPHVTEIEMDDQNPSAMLSIADVTVYEAPGSTLDFVVTLTGTPAGTVTVSYATQDGTATANVDYTPRSGVVTFPLGTTTRTVSVTVQDDLVDKDDEQDERMTLRLSNAIGAGILDGVAYGTIENSEQLPHAWLARFGRVAADQAEGAISGRLTQSGPRNSQVTVAGQRLDISGTMSPTQTGASPWGAIGAAPGIGSARPGSPGLHGAVGAARGYTSGGAGGRQLLSGTSFQWALGVDDEMDEDGDGNPDGPANGSAGGEPRANWTAWGEGAATRFSGVEESLSLQGDVATATLGVDREGERWMAGVAVAFSEGEGAFAPVGHDMAGSNTGTVEGQLATTLTSVYPYARYAVNDRLSFWGVLGYGQGELRLTEGRSGTSFDTDTGLRMGALGARGVVLDARGFELALRTDAMQVQMYSDAVIGLAGATAETGRIRALLEGSRMFTLGTNRSLEPTLELGLRHDSGDAETGSGIELGAGIRYTDAVLGLSLEANARGLVAHQDSAYQEWGAWATLRLDPGEQGHGLSLSLSPTWGAASSGIDRLWNSASTPGYGAGSPGHAAGSQGHAAGSWLDPGGRLSAELGYGVDAFQGRGMGIYYSGLERAGSGFQRWRLGKRWELGSQLQMSVEGERHESSVLPPDHAISVQGLLLW